MPFVGANGIRPLLYYIWWFCVSPDTYNLAQRCAAAVVTVASGAANHKNYAAQRVYREALVYTVAAQTTDIMEATLKNLVRRF
ncbi:hypothetical protein [Okeania sp. SIO3I5]|uniref:hypothetical protein n=1 Tax=Okeania sp. SIO3I5 TaxID=2607805 RepID=UPI0034413CD9